MAQSEVIKFLEKHPERFWTTNEIAEKIKALRHNVNRNCKAMVKFGEIRKKERLIGRTQMEYSYCAIIQGVKK